MYETFGELVNRTAYLLNFNRKQVDGDFDPAIIGDAVNSVYEAEWNRVLDTADLAVTEITYDTTWAASLVNLPYPTALTGLRLNDLVVVENDGTETQLVTETDGAYFYWRPNGPDSTLNIRFKYCRIASKMVAVNDKPSLFPKNQREFLAWAAAIQLKGIADQQVPEFFTRTYVDLRESALKATEKVLANQRHQYSRQGTEITDTVDFNPQ